MNKILLNIYNSEHFYKPFYYFNYIVQYRYVHWRIKTLIRTGFREQPH